MPTREMSCNTSVVGSNTARQVKNDTRFMQFPDKCFVLLGVQPAEWIGSI